MGLDVGPESIAQFVTVVEKSSTIVWNGYVTVTIATISVNLLYFLGQWVCLNLKNLPLDLRLFWMQLSWQPKREPPLSLVSAFMCPSCDDHVIRWR